MGPTSHTLHRCKPARSRQLWQHPAGHPTWAESWDWGPHLWPEGLRWGPETACPMMHTSQLLLVCLAGALGIRYWAPPKISPEGQEGCSEAECLHLRAGRGHLPFTETGAPPDMPGLQEGLCPPRAAGWAGAVSVLVGGSHLLDSAQKMQKLSMGTQMAA